MLERLGYIEEYIAFGSDRPEVARIWVSLYTPQKGENTAEMLSARDRQLVVEELLKARERHPKLLMGPRLAEAIRTPPRDPDDCMFARMSTNFSADLKTRVEPCIFGGTPDCSQCGCAISSGLHLMKKMQFGIVKIEHLARGSAAIGSVVGKLRRDYREHPRWKRGQLSIEQPVETEQEIPKAS